MFLSLNVFVFLNNLKLEVSQTLRVHLRILNFGVRLNLDLRPFANTFDLRFPPKIGLLFATRLVMLFNPGWSYFDPYTIQSQLKVHFALVHRRMFSKILFMLIFVGRSQRVHLVPKPHWNSSASSGLRQESEESNFNCSLHHLNATTTLLKFLNKERNMI